jgi:16S rRNA (guanine(966)-N(2))-methyltransferase RsmD
MKSMRVIAGKYRSRPLQSLRGLDLRPTADRLRETLFNVLTAGNADALAGTVWLDLFAGTGSVGIEALSRGAEMVYFAEASPRAAELVRRNLRKLGVEKGPQVLQQDAVRAVRALETQALTVDFVFLDPPYRLAAAYEATLGALAKSTLIKPSSVIVAEHEKRFDPGEEFDRLRRYRKLEQSDAVLSFYRL